MLGCGVLGAGKTLSAPLSRVSCLGALTLKVADQPAHTYLFKTFAEGGLERASLPPRQPGFALCGPVGTGFRQHESGAWKSDPDSNVTLYS